MPAGTIGRGVTAAGTDPGATIVRTMVVGFDAREEDFDFAADFFGFVRAERVFAGRFFFMEIRFDVGSMRE